MRETWVLSVVFVILLSLTIFYPSLGWTLRTALFREDDSKAAYERVLQENTILQAIHATDMALAGAGAVGGNGSQNVSGLESASSTPQGTPAFIFSRSPFNYKDQVLVSVGRAQGVKEGDVAVVGVHDPGILIGKVITVFDATALVRTVFDVNFESAVRVGDQGIDALLKGGDAPHVTLIPRRAGIRVGDIVYAAGASIPYGLPIGTIQSINPAADNVFEEATLSVAYDMNTVTAVRIIHGLTQ